MALPQKGSVPYVVDEDTGVVGPLQGYSGNQGFVLGVYVAGPYAPEGDDLSSSLQAASQRVMNFNYVFDGTDWDRARSLASDSDAQAAAQVGLRGVVSRGQGFNGTTYDRLRSGANNADGVAALSAGVSINAGTPMLWNGATLDRARGANVFKSIEATASGETLVWDPSASRRVRLMGLEISVCGTLATLGVLSILLRDGTGGTIVFRGKAAVSTAVAGDTQIFADYGQGMPLTVNNNLYVDLSATLTSGGCAVNAWGTEET